MTLCELKKALKKAGIEPALHAFRDLKLADLSNDSRRVTPGALFVAHAGARADGHDFVPEAIRSGAEAILAERHCALFPNVPQLVVSDIRTASAVAAATFFGHPSGVLRVVGITGTNGKTTTSLLVSSILRAVGTLGTISYKIGAREIPAPVTTPDAIELQRFFYAMLQSGADWAVMEVSSHSLVQRRVACTRFEIGAFTNLTRDHLDYHKTMEEYRAAKGLLFASLPATGHAVINADDPAGLYMASVSKAKVVRWGFAGASPLPLDVAIEKWSTSMLGTTVSLRTPAGRIEVQSKLVGKHNVGNIACAVACGLAAAAAPEIIKRGVEEVQVVRGRLEPVDCGQGFSVFVDYAHTDDALANVLEALREMTTGRLIVVFGCGGDRDRGKRPLMGAVAEKFCDLVIVTSDNPRSEQPAAIVAEICTGIKRKDCSRVQVDRAEAIRDALRCARSGDTVLIAGKGHEQYQIFGDCVRPFDDRVVARDFLSGVVK
jgi:UDP-N-acetylmuramoyl-L-alanyl-D-glutamate--2,6-diaminopimelate ligase